MLYPHLVFKQNPNLGYYTTVTATTSFDITDDTLGFPAANIHSALLWAEITGGAVSGTWSLALASKFVEDDGTLSTAMAGEYVNTTDTGVITSSTTPGNAVLALPGSGAAENNTTRMASPYPFSVGGITPVLIEETAGSIPAVRFGIAAWVIKP